MNLRSLITACLVVLAAALPAVLLDIDGAPQWLAQGGAGQGKHEGSADAGARTGTTPGSPAPRF